MENSSLLPVPSASNSLLRTFEEAIRVGEEALLPGARSLPWVCRLLPASDDKGSLALTPQSAGQWLEDRLQQHGAVLLRGLPIGSAQEFEAALRFFAVAMGDDLTGNSRRSTVHGRIYQSSRLEPHHVLDLHNEATYKAKPPRRLYFCTLTVAPDGGETPLGDSQRVFARIDSAIRDEFLRRGVMYVRHSDDDTHRLIQSWQESFQTTDRSEVEKVCSQQGIGYQWYGDNGLKLTETRAAAIRHPVTQDWSWISQVQLNHRCRWVRTGVLPDGLPDHSYPTGCYFGDGGEIPLEWVGHIRHCWLQEEQYFEWQSGDILVLDNLWVAHGRRPYYGPRRLLLALSH